MLAFAQSFGGLAVLPRNLLASLGVLGQDWLGAQLEAWLGVIVVRPWAL